MSFDEIFGIFLPVFSYSPPANAEAVNSLLMRLSGLSLSSSLDFSKLLLNSAIDTLIDPTIEQEEVEKVTEPIKDVKNRYKK